MGLLDGQTLYKGHLKAIIWMALAAASAMDAMFKLCYSISRPACTQDLPSPTSHA